MYQKADCPNCGALYDVQQVYEGKLCGCPNCGAKFLVPFDEADELLDWAQSVDWPILRAFISKGIGRGHTRETIDALIRIFEIRRDAEMERQRVQAFREQEERTLLASACMTTEERNLIDRLTRCRDKSYLQQLTPGDFEEMVADLFRACGLLAERVGAAYDDGIDVIVRDSMNQPIAVAQCKRYSPGKRVSAQEVREVAGSFMMSGAKKAYIFTTSRYTRAARRTARHFSWLKILNGKRTAEAAAKAIDRLVALQTEAKVDSPNPGFVLPF